MATSEYRILITKR